MVLHTWGQNLLFHPHVHCVVTTGGLSFDGTRWIAAREKYLLPVKVFGKLFRWRFLAALDRAYRNGEFDLASSTTELADPEAWRRFKDGLYKKDWVVFAKPPFGGVEQVFNYSSRRGGCSSLTPRRQNPRPWRPPSRSRGGNGFSSRPAST